MTHGRKPREPRWIPTAETMKLASHRAAKVHQADIAEVMTPLQQAFKALREGVATEWQWSVAASAVNVAKAVEKQGVVKGLYEHLRAADLALQSIYQRAMLRSGWRATSLNWIELDAISTAVDLHKFQLDQLSNGEIMQALQFAEAEIRSSGGRVIKLDRCAEGVPA
jgi:hypothetical protein